MQALRYQLRTRTLPPAAQHMLQLAADPTRQLSSSGQGTLRRGPVHLLTGEGCVGSKGALACCL